MKLRSSLRLVRRLGFALAGLALVSTVALRAAPATPVRVLLVTGGHEFDTNQFFQMFRDNSDIRVETVVQPAAAEWFGPPKADQYDVLVCYDMWQSISEPAKSNFVARLNRGKGLVILHHALANYQKWDAYLPITGGRYNLEKRTTNGVEIPASTYQHDVDIPVTVANRQHPVTRGIPDFQIHDETYGTLEVLPGVDVLLTADHPTSNRVIGWAKTYGPARVVCLQLGHDRQAYANPNYRKLVAQAIAWAGGR